MKSNGLKTAILTSIPPLIAQVDVQKQYEEQRRCIESWIRAGHIPISINHEEDILLLETQFTDVRFEPSNCPRSPMSGRSLVYVSDAIKTALTLAFDRLALCNPDVLINYPTEFASVLPKDLPLAFTSRMCSYPYFEGGKENEEDFSFDYINLSTDFASSLHDTGFLFGQPWWDYWLVMEGLKVQPPVELTSETGNILANQFMSNDRKDERPSDRMLIYYALHCFATIANIGSVKLVDQNQVESSINTLVNQPKAPVNVRKATFFHQLKVQVSAFIRAHAKQIALPTRTLHNLM